MYVRVPIAGNLCNMFERGAKKVAKAKSNIYNKHEKKLPFDCWKILLERVHIVSEKPNCFPAEY